MRISRKIGLPIAMMAVGGFVAYGAFYWFLSRTRSDLRFVELAALTKVRTDQVGRLARSPSRARAWAREEIAELVRLVDEGHAVLADGGEAPSGDLEPAPPGLADDLAQVRSAWIPARELLLRIAGSPLEGGARAEADATLERLLPELTRATEELLAEARARSERLRARMQLTLGAICVADVLLLVLGVAIIHRGVLRPLDVLERAALRVKNGDLSQPVPVASRDELGHLSAAFNEMTDAVRSLLEREARVKQSLRALSGKLLSVQDDERRRLARELHDSTVQTLAAATIRLGEVRADELSRVERSGLEDTRQLLEHASNELRNLSYLLHPPLLEGLGFLTALEDYVSGFSERSGLEIELDLPEDRGSLALDEATELALFRVVQEALANVQKHAGTTSATIRLRAEGPEVTLEISDRGRGMSEGQLEAVASGIGGGVGIGGMRERIAHLGGVFEIDAHESGTRVRVAMPRRGSR